MLVISNSPIAVKSTQPAIYSSIKSLNKIDEKYEIPSVRNSNSDTIVTSLKQHQNKKLSGSYSDLIKSNEYQQHYENDDVFYNQNVVPPPMPFSYTNNKPYYKSQTYRSRSPTLTNSVTLSEVSGRLRKIKSYFIE